MNEENAGSAETLNETLAKIVAKRLRDKGLIADVKVKDLTSKVAEGKATQDDWRAWVEFVRLDSGEATDDAAN